MVKLILIKSPDEWATTKLVCRDEVVVYLFFTSAQYIYSALLLFIDHCFTEIKFCNLYSTYRLKISKLKNALQTSHKLEWKQFSSRYKQKCLKIKQTHWRKYILSLTCEMVLMLQMKIMPNQQAWSFPYRRAVSSTCRSVRKFDVTRWIPNTTFNTT